ncbi:MAG: HAMP domain-containing histidine kinase [Flavobacteriales bacterium]|nr:HAMP domain-containing histidine kinase [Flavobacteriales bacterium]
MMTFIARIQKSIFGRLFFIFAITAFAIILVISLSFKKAFNNHVGPQQRYHSLMKSHIRYLLDDIGSPPDEAKVKKLTTMLDIKIMLEGPNGLWRSHKKMISPEKLSIVHTIDEQMSIAAFRNKRFIVFQVESYTYYITGMRPFMTDYGRGWLIFAFILTLLLIFLSYRSVKWLFRPLNEIKLGAKRISEGELSYRIDNRRYDEIGEITQSVNNMAEELEKMIEAKRQLLLGISHELRSPLTRVKVGIEFINDPKVKQSIADDVNELDSLICELLEAERLNQRHAALQIDRFDLNELLESVVSDLGNGNDLIQLDLPNPPIIVQMDTLRIKLLIRNLVGNALKYGDDQSVDLSQHGSEICIKVSDQGVGIEEQHIVHLTEPFYRADSARQRQTGGYGLGLYLCRLIVEAHNGTLTIHSRLNEGTTITATFHTP